MERLRSGGIVEDDSDSKGPSEGNTPVALANEATQSSTQKKANDTRAAKMKPKKKASTTRSLKGAKKSGASKGVDAAAQREVAAKLVLQKLYELEPAGAEPARAGPGSSSS